MVVPIMVPLLLIWVPAWFLALMLAARIGRVDGRGRCESGLYVGFAVVFRFTGVAGDIVVTGCCAVWVVGAAKTDFVVDACLLRKDLISSAVFRGLWNRVAVGGFGATAFLGGSKRILRRSPPKTLITVHREYMR